MSNTDRLWEANHSPFHIVIDAVIVYFVMKVFLNELFRDHLYGDVDPFQVVYVSVQLKILHIHANFWVVCIVMMVFQWILKVVM